MYQKYCNLQIENTPRITILLTLYFMNYPMEFLPIKTRTFMPPKDDLWKLIDDYVPALKE